MKTSRHSGSQVGFSERALFFSVYQGMEDRVMSIKHPPLVNQYLQAALSENTRKAYRTDLKQFIQWGGRIPSSPQRVALYLAEHAEQLSFSTLRRRLVAIGKAHEARNLPSPTQVGIVKATLHGILRLNGSKRRRVEPVLLNDVQKMVKGLRGMSGLRDKALLLVGFSGALRRCELVSIRVEDVSFVEKGMVIHLRRSKTDQVGKGRDIAVPFLRGNYCPVKALRSWIEFSGIRSGAVFRRVDRYGNLLGKALSSQSVALIIKQRAESIGMNATLYSGHSLRAGLVTSAAKSGVSAWKICQQTGHKSESVMYGYIRDSDLFNNHPLKRIRESTRHYLSQ